MVPKKRSRQADDSYCYLDKTNSTITIVGEINQRVASLFRRCVRALERRNRPITVEINSPGGDIEAGLMIIDTIELSTRKVTTRVTGQACSMAAVILASGDKREALQNSTVMVHYGSYSFAARFDEMNKEMDEAVRLERLCSKILDTKSHKRAGYWEKKSRKGNYYMNAELALAEGLVDRVLRPKKSQST